MSTPFAGAPWTLPGTVEVEAFDNGGEGVAYHDTDATNSGGAYRSSGVDIETSSSGGNNVGWVAAGEWLAYTVSIPAAGSYMAQFRVASYGAGGTFHLEVDGVNVTGAMTVPDTGWWQTWQTISRQVALPAGRQLARLVMDTPGANAVGNFDWFAITSPSPRERRCPAGSSPPISIPAPRAWRITTIPPATAAEPTARPDVDIEACAEGGYNVGWIARRRMAAILGECCGVRLVRRPPAEWPHRTAAARCIVSDGTSSLTGPVSCSAHWRLAGVDHHFGADCAGGGAADARRRLRLAGIQPAVSRCRDPVIAGLHWSCDDGFPA